MQVLPVRRHAAVVVLGALCAVASACSGGGPSATPTTLPPGVAVLGASYGTWLRGHPAVQAGGQSGYGTAVRLDGTTVPEFTDVRRQGGRVVALHMTLPAGSLERAERLVRAQLPTDALQTASWRGDFASADGHCEFVNYQSASLARHLGVAAPTGSTADIGTSLYERTAHGRGSPSIATVNSADLSTTPAGPSQSC
ncbi:MAG TPA: hypothetical protein VMB72_12375 [Acidimicrobiales bacterium]|nr:hypothetical protein [Acidimicrobiales bacterium]